MLFSLAFPFRILEQHCSGSIVNFLRSDGHSLRATTRITIAAIRTRPDCGIKDRFILAGMNQANGGHDLQCKKKPGVWPGFPFKCIVMSVSYRAEVLPAAAAAALTALCPVSPTRSLILHIHLQRLRQFGRDHRYGQCHRRYTTAPCLADVSSPLGRIRGDK